MKNRDTRFFSTDGSFNYHAAMEAGHLERTKFLHLILKKIVAPIAKRGSVIAALSRVLSCLLPAMGRN